MTILKPKSNFDGVFTQNVARNTRHTLHLKTVFSFYSKFILILLECITNVVVRQVLIYLNKVLQILPRGWDLCVFTANIDHMVFRYHVFNIIICHNLNK